ncbi:MAG: hypothetical protein ACRDRK_00910 [Pseudonocardia sp.]
MGAGLDTLVAALSVRIGGLLEASPGRAPWRPRVGVARGSGSPEGHRRRLVTLSVVQVLLGRTRC